MPNGGLDEDGEPVTIQKRYGYIYDYEGLLGDLKDAMNTYKALQGFDENDLRGVVKPIKEIIDELPGAHRRLLDLFKPVKNKLDHEQMEQHLRDDVLRKEFSNRLSEFARLLEQALGSEKAYDYIKDEQMKQFRGDWLRLKNLRRSAALRFQDTVDMREYEPRILQLLNDNVAADPAKMIINPIDLSVKGAVEEAVAKYGAALGTGTGETSRAKADRIERSAKKYIRDKLEQHDPALARKFSEMIEEALQAYAQKRLDDQQLAEELTKITQDMIEGRKEDELPHQIRDDADAAAFFGLIGPYVADIMGDSPEAKSASAEIAAKIKELLLAHKIVRFWANDEAMNRFRDALDDYFFDEVGRKMAIKIPVQKLDELQGALLKTAQRRFPDA